MRHAGLLVAGLLALAACASQQATAPSPLIAARDQLVADIQQCSRQYGYDPKKAAGIAENALAPNELPWRQCAYDAARRYVKANPAMASTYEQIIAEDIAMTTAIQQGTMTRSQRRDRLAKLIDQARAKEEEQVRTAAADKDRETQHVRAVYQSVHGLSL